MHKIEKIIREVAAAHGLSDAIVRTTHRQASGAVKARHEAIRRAWSETTYTTADIARVFNMDPSSVRYALRKAALRNTTNDDRGVA